MAWPQLIAYFFGGAFLANAVPHAVSGMLGRPFQSPFAKPPGQVRIPMKSAMHSNLKPATASELKPAGVPI
jgi:hypothetical protein